MVILIYLLIPILTELLITLLFKFKGKKLYLYLLGVNLVIQLLTCSLLPIFYGSLILLFAVPVAVILFFIIEIALHARFIPKLSNEVSRSRALLYAVVANIASIAVEVIITIAIN